MFSGQWIRILHVVNNLIVHIMLHMHLKHCFWIVASKGFGRDVSCSTQCCFVSFADIYFETVRRRNA